MGFFDPPPIRRSRISEAGLARIRAGQMKRWHGDSTMENIELTPENESTNKRAGYSHINVFVPEKLKTEAQQIAKDENVNLTDVVIVGLQAYLADSSKLKQLSRRYEIRTLEKRLEQLKSELEEEK